MKRATRQQVIAFSLAMMIKSQQPKDLCRHVSICPWVWSLRACVRAGLRTLYMQATIPDPVSERAPQHNLLRRRDGVLKMSFWHALLLLVSTFFVAKSNALQVSVSEVHNYTKP